VIVLNIMNERDYYSSTIGELLKKTPSFQNAGKAGYHPGLQTMIEFDMLLGHPHTAFKTIHIAGTNGKGSVAHFMAAVLAAAGFRTGLYTSPHLVDFRERIKIVEPCDNSGKISNRMIPEDDVLSFLSTAGSFISEKSPSFFEITTAMAFDWFRKQKVDIAVIECGLGGRLDSTNIIRPVLSIITTIGYDHKDILGDTIVKIASEKAGIIKRNVPTVIGKMPDEARDVMLRTASEVGTSAVYCPDYAGAYKSCLGKAAGTLQISEMDLQCSVQHLNLQTVSTAIDTLIEGKVLKDDAGIISYVLDGLRHTASCTGLRGRWEIMCDRPAVICDIGHNENALAPVMLQLKKLCDERHPDRIYMIYGMAGDKDIGSVIHLLPQNAIYVFTNAKGSRAMPAIALKNMVTEGWGSVRDDFVTDSVEEAVSKVFGMAGVNDVIYVGGSSYVVAEAIPLIEWKIKDRLM